MMSFNILDKDVVFHVDDKEFDLEVRVVNVQSVPKAKKIINKFITKLKEENIRGVS